MLSLEVAKWVTIGFSPIHDVLGNCVWSSLNGHVRKGQLTLVAMVLTKAVHMSFISRGGWVVAATKMSMVNDIVAVSGGRQQTRYHSYSFGVVLHQVTHRFPIIAIVTLFDALRAAHHNPHCAREMEFGQHSSGSGYGRIVCGHLEWYSGAMCRMGVDNLVARLISSGCGVRYSAREMSVVRAQLGVHGGWWSLITSQNGG